MTPPAIDRLSPTRRPSGRAVQRARWLELAFLHWRVPSEVLRPLLPAELDVDTFDGDAFVGIVPFTMRGVRPPFAPPLPWISAFHETNVRTYVHRRGRDPGVWFFSLDAASRLAVLVARTLLHLRYHYARMELRWHGDAVHYASTRRWPGPLPARCRVACRPLGAPAAAIPGTLEHFLVERYLLYTTDRRGSLIRGAVHHAAYPLQCAEVLHCEQDLTLAAGIPAAITDRPPLAHFAREVDVEVFPLRRVKASRDGE